MKRISKSACALLLVLTLVVGICTSASAASTSSEVSDRETTNSQLSRQAAAQGMVLLENKDNVLPITAKNKKIALFGSGARHTVKGGTGSGDVNQRYVISIDEGFKKAGYEITSTAWLNAYDAAYEEGKANWSGGMFSAFSLPDTEITDDQIASSKSTDTAVYVIARNSGEGSDRKNEEGDYLLTENETENLTKLGANFKNVAVLLNVGGVIDTKFFDEIPGLDALLLVSQPGMEAGNAVADVVSGKVTPSGKLTDTWAKEYSDYSSSETFSSNDGNTKSEEYTDGIYVGYRYFDTFNITPQYEFGYGKSYTTFNTKIDSVTATKKNVTVKATVTNTGSTYSGKEVVQVYFSAPEGTLEKPYQELAGYAKTDLLAPGQKQTLTISYLTTEMSSYDTDSASYVMEKGDYIIRAGNSSRNTHVGAIVRLDNDVTTEQLSNQLTPEEELEEISSQDKTPYSYPSEAAEIKTAKVIALSAEDFETEDHASPYSDETVTTYLLENEVKDSGDKDSGDVDGQAKDSGIDYEVTETVEKQDGLTLKDVYDKDITMQEFVAQMSLEQMANIVNGIGWGQSGTPVIGSSSDSVPGAAGETTKLYWDSGISNMILSDGPAGLRLTQKFTGQDANDDNKEKTYYQYCTAWPIGTLLAMTWDRDLVQQVGKAIGTEMSEYGVTLWLAPGMNIHRNPLCGRNFEYFSEDPLVTGLCASAETLGVQSHPGIGVTIKHFFTNNQENNRSSENNIVSERTLREIYLKGFEIAVKTAQPMAIMTSYNQLNGKYVAANYETCTDIPRGEWGFKGLIMTDWGCQADAGESMHAGNDMIQPGGSQTKIIQAASIVEPLFNEDGTIKLTKTTSPWFGEQEVENWNSFVPILNEGHKSSEKYTADKYVTTVVDGHTTYAGEYKQPYITKGDLQKSVANILNIVMQSSQFAKKYNLKPKSYSSQFELPNYVETQKSSVTGSNNSGHHSGGTKTSGTSSTPPTGPTIIGSVITTSTGTFITDTTTDVRVKGSYTVKITSENGQPPRIVAGTAGVFEVQMTTTDGKIYFIKLIPIGQPGTQAGIYLDGVKLFAATVEAPVSTVKSDTTHPFKIKSGASYVIKLTAGSRPTIVPGTAGIFRVEFVRSSGNDYFFRIIPIGKAGGSSGLYINSEKNPVAVATIA
ncbi:glycoside hydrolase family 3 protein [Caproiciproducens faecalis]|uniref:Glycoside hydrolase family 3 C-terminal domain-containing protein n=1 Tax=Caproiciproducens faecalis TaxID=2820301 RepID=A0ABS7DJE7_9FIRM|nr:glycoside hydrolase family 3 protein [Caproiciproducens faecalis]MBW7571343.1 glycoside hydrolase family 3 C-terminal domain-containing protein [Caproiciproducens faecalis]